MSTKPIQELSIGNNSKNNTNEKDFVSKQEFDAKIYLLEGKINNIDYKTNWILGVMTALTTAITVHLLAQILVSYR